MGKRLIALFIAGVILTAAPAYGKEVTVERDGEALSVTAVLVEDCVMVGMRQMFNILGADVVWNPRNFTAYANAPGVSAAFTIDSDEAFVNGEIVIMPVPAQMIDGQTMVPLQFVGELFGYEVSWSRAAARMSLNTPIVVPEYETVLDIDSLATGTVRLSYEDAVKKAVAKNNSIKDLEDNQERLFESRNQIYTYYIMSSTNTTSTLVSGLRNISQIDYAMRNAPLQKEMIAAGAEYMLRDSISVLAQTGMDILLLNESIGLKETELNNLELKLSLGLASENEVRDTKRNIEQSQVQLRALETSVVSQKEALAIMLGYKADVDISVSYNPEFNDEDINIEKKIRDIDKDPSIIIQSRVLEQAQYEYDTSYTMWDVVWSNMMPESKLEKENAVVSARRALEDSKTNMERALRTANNNLKSLVDNQRTLEMEVEKAHDLYDTMAVNLRAGVVTAYELDQARVGILKAEIDAQKNIYTIDNLRFTIDRPYMLVQ